jgi:hypothetical protein
MAKLRMTRFGNGRDLKTERPRIRAAKLHECLSDVDTSVTPARVLHSLDAQKGFTASLLVLYSRTSVWV